MKIGILETGVPPLELRQIDGSYGDMMRRMLGKNFETECFDVVADGPPSSVAACDGYLITGSPAGVYEDKPWIAPLAAFVRDAEARAPMVGICFGHQLMAHALGGQVVKSPKGWGIGLHTYRVVRAEPWMDRAAAVAIVASHQDQVVVAPPCARAVLASDFTPLAGLAYGDWGLSVQCHPEMSIDFAAALYDRCRGRLYEDKVADEAVATLARPNDRARVGAWIRGFFARSAD
jgi:GMP synthase-like glutamine amidotransferase